jgi:hypothetical protein
MLRVNHVSLKIREICLAAIESCHSDTLMKLPEYPTADHQAKMSILRIPFIGSIRSLQVDVILASLFGMADKIPGYKSNLAVNDGSNLDWLVRIYHASQTSHYLDKGVDRDRQLLVFWGVWSVCQYLINGKLKSCFGNPGQVGFLFSYSLDTRCA